jgi:hypothetical protein
LYHGLFSDAEGRHWLDVMMLATICVVAAVRFGLLTLVWLQLFFGLSLLRP